MCAIANPDLLISTHESFYATLVFLLLSSLFVRLCQHNLRVARSTKRHFDIKPMNEAHCCSNENGANAEKEPLIIVNARVCRASSFA